MAGDARKGPETIQSWWSSGVCCRPKLCGITATSVEDLARGRASRWWMRLNNVGCTATKSAGGRPSPRLVHSSIECFLEGDLCPVDIVAFSSVLHHLYDYTSVVQQAPRSASGESFTEPGSVVRNIRLQLTYLTPWTLRGKECLNPADLLPESVVLLSTFACDPCFSVRSHSR